MKRCEDVFVQGFLRTQERISYILSPHCTKRLLQNKRLRGLAVRRVRCSRHWAPHMEVVLTSIIALECVGVLRVQHHEVSLRTRMRQASYSSNNSGSQMRLAGADPPARTYWFQHALSARELLLVATDQPWGSVGIAIGYD